MLSTTHTLPRVVLLAALALGMSLGPSSTALAQPSPEQMKQRMAARTDTRIQQLNLTATQEEPVRAILEAANAKRMDLMAKARQSGSFMGMREDMEALNEETEKKLEDVLTEAQMATYRKIQDEQRNRRGGPRGGL